jgi:PKD repeat protein
LLAAAFSRAPDPAPAAPPKVTASFTFEPASPFTYQTVNFTSTSTANVLPLSEQWDLDGDGVFDDASGPTAERSFSHSGDRTVSLQVSDANGLTAVASQTVPVQNRPPNASFEYSPVSPQTNETVTFTSTSTDSDGTVKSTLWDLDNDGQFDDGSGVTVQRSFRTAGSYTVQLRVNDDHGVASFTSQTVQVGNRPPNVSFAYVPSNPLPGQVISFFSTASDPDGPLAQQAWDLDNDGQFDDATGPSAARSFDSPGGYIIGLRATDDQGVSASGFQTVTVHPPSTLATALGLRLLTPFPIVRISGIVTARGAKLRRLSVTAPQGASILVRCRGHSCPLTRYARQAVAANASVRAWAARLVRIRGLEGHLLRTGTRLEVFVRKAGMIGKYTRFRIRSDKAPTRLDRCLLSNKKRPVRCSS